MKKQIKVLIGDDSVEFGVNCASILRYAGMYAVTRPHDVKRIFETIINDKPDVVVLESAAIQNIGLIQKAKQIDRRVKFIVVSSYENFYAKGDADYFLLKPFDMNVLIDVINSLAASECEINPDDIQAAVTEIMHNIGIPAHVKGYNYLREAIIASAEDERLIGSITKNLYPYIAQMFNSTASGVERAMRHAIEIAWVRGNYEMFVDFFGEKRPANSEFIALIADMIKVSHKCAVKSNVC